MILVLQGDFERGTLLCRRNTHKNHEIQFKPRTWLEGGRLSSSRSGLALPSWPVETTESRNQKCWPLAGWETLESY